MPVFGSVDFDVIDAGIISARSVSTTTVIALIISVEIKERVLGVEFPIALKCDELNRGLKTRIFIVFAPPRRLKVLSGDFFANEILSSDVGGFGGAPRVAIVSIGIWMKLAILRWVLEKEVGISACKRRVS